MKRYICITACFLLILTAWVKWPLIPHQLPSIKTKMVPCSNLQNISQTDIPSQIHYFFHSHREGEAGHFHIFLIDEDQSFSHHIVGASIDHEGNLINLFLTDSWVTNDDPIPSASMMAHLDQLDSTAPLNPWIKTLLEQHKKDIERLHTFCDRLKSPAFGRYEVIVEQAVRY